MESLGERLQTGHQDIVHDIAFDFYGRRLVTCSSDQTLKVWLRKSDDASEGDDTHNATAANISWTLQESWKAHDASILKVTWAHPEYGRILASCSVDRSVRIWEEQDGPGQKWSEKARLVDSRGTVVDVKFAPHHLGLKLATVSVDGFLRVYEAMDVMNLAHWTLMEDVQVSSESFSAAGMTSREPDSEYCLDWCKSRILPQMIAVGCGRDKTVQIFAYDEAARSWAVSDSLPGHGDVIHDIAWAPSIGRSYQLVATASKDKHVRIFKLTPNTNGSKTENTRFKIELVGDFDSHNAEVWRVEWNVTGTVLSSSGDDGRVMLWKANYLGEWTCMSTLDKEDESMGR